MATQFTPYADAVEKQKARMFVSMFYNGGRVLSMSSSNFGFEQTLAKMHNNISRVDAYEYDYEVYHNGKRTLAQIKENIRNIHFKYDNIFNATPHKYDFMFLDFCGTITPQMLIQLTAFLQGFDGTVIITVQKGREVIPANILHYYGAKNTTEYREQVVPRVLNEYSGLTESIPRYEYANKSVNAHAPHMQMYGFQRLSAGQINYNPLLPEEKRNARRYIERFGFSCEIPTTKMAYDNFANGIQNNLQYATAYIQPSQSSTLTL